MALKRGAPDCDVMASAAHLDGLEVERGGYGSGLAVVACGRPNEAAGEAKRSMTEHELRREDLAPATAAALDKALELYHRRHAQDTYGGSYVANVYWELSRGVPGKRCRDCGMDLSFARYMYLEGSWGREMASAYLCCACLQRVVSECVQKDVTAGTLDRALLDLRYEQGYLHWGYLASCHLRGDTL